MKPSRLIVKKKNEFVALPLADVVLFSKENNHLTIYDKYSNEYEYKCSIQKLMEELDKEQFFQANRQQIVNLNFIKGFRTVDKVKLRISFHFIHDELEVIISQETAPLFKRWLQGFSIN